MRLALVSLLLLLAPSALAQDAARDAAAEVGLLFDPERGLDIESDELEAVRSPDGGDRIVFRGGVRAVQQDTRLACDWLETLYPDGGGAPQRITARGSVHMTGSQTEIRCSEMVYEASACRVTCRGDGQDAVVTKAEDVIRGREIELDLCTNTVRVRGGAAIRLRPRPDSATDAEPSE